MKQIIFITILFSAHFLQAQLNSESRIDSLKQVLKNQTTDSMRAHINYRIAYEYRVVDVNQMSSYIYKGLEISRKAGWKKGEGVGYNYLGNLYYMKGDIDSAVSSFEKSIIIKSILKDSIGISNTLNNIGTIYYVQANYPKSLEYYLRSSKISDDMSDFEKVAGIYGNIANVYSLQDNKEKAFEYNYLALNYYDKSEGQENRKARVLKQLAGLLSEVNKFDKALDTLRLATKYFIEIDDKEGIASCLSKNADIYKLKGDFIRASHNREKALEYYKNMKYDMALTYVMSELASDYLSIIGDSILSTEMNVIEKESYLNKSIGLLEEVRELSTNYSNNQKLVDIYMLLSKAHKLKGNYKKSLEALETANVLNDTIFNLEREKTIAEMTAIRDKDLTEKENLILSKENAYKQTQIIIISISSIIALLISIFAFLQWKRSERLLQNVLPKIIARRLKRKQLPIADKFEQASIIFIDIIHFTKLTKELSPEQMIIELNKIFSKFDQIASKHGLEKIKTMGDAYMAASGIPVANKDNAYKAAAMAVEVQGLMNDYFIGETKIDVRIGLDCGPVIAGVIGEQKFIYDLWSDSVNTASRMESTGISGRIQLTARFKEAIPSIYFQFEERGEIEIKGLGNMKTYFLESKN